ncbi:MAG: hypothetical protein ACE15E_14225 [Acidobacteriota bacterium]
MSGHIQETRRSFFRLASLATTVLWAGRKVSGETRNRSVTDFRCSYLHCRPTGSGIWVRVQLECISQAFDTVSGKSDDYYLSVKAQTGLGATGIPGRRHPGYEYWMIFSKTRVLMKRLHTSSYLSDPSTVLSSEFGPNAARIQARPGRALRNYAEVETALKGWQSLTARTTFLSRDRKKGYRVEYPVKWADVNEERKAFRVETGPVLLLDPEKVHAGAPVKFEDFQWAHLDYHSFDSVRCLIERPTDILSDAGYQLPASTPSQTRHITPEQLAAIEKRFFEGWNPPVGVEGLRKMLQTDRYSDAVDRACQTELFALE